MKQVKSKSATNAASRDEVFRQSEDRLSAVVALTSDFFWEQDADLRFTVYRHRHAGSPSSETYKTIVGKTQWELSQRPTEGHEGWQKYEALVAAREPFRDILQPLPDLRAGTRYLSFSGQPIFDAQGTFQVCVANYQSIA